MLWIFALLLQIAVIAAGMRNAQRAHQWSWPLFLFLLGFAALECAILIVPVYYIHDVHNRYFWPVFVASWLVGLANMVWMILKIRRWKPAACDCAMTREADPPRS
jgi:hypothetical protein